MTQFEDLGLSKPILKALAQEGYTAPTPIQTQAIPHVLLGRDLLGLAQTGTGKTAAFALPMLERLAAERKHAGARACRALVLAPTRELAGQIADSFRAYGRFLGLSTTVVFGGASMHKQRFALERGVDILVATPGRLLDHVSQRSVKLDTVEILVLDEADHMLDMGFIHDLRRIAKLLPEQRQSLFFSATMPAPIAELADQFLREPEKVAVTPVSSTAERVEQAVVHVENALKQKLLHALLEERPEIVRALVFARTKHGANRVVENLLDAGFSAEAIHGNKSQGQRERALDAFKKGKARLLVATEIAARGIDVDGVSHVINFDLPNVPEQYVHRIGRTARAGATGLAISFCAPDERAYLKDIEKLTKLAVPVLSHEMSLPTPAPGERTPKPPARNAGRNAGRGGGRSGQPQRAHGPRKERMHHEAREKHDGHDGKRQNSEGVARAAGAEKPRFEGQRSEKPWGEKAFKPKAKRFGSEGSGQESGKRGFGGRDSDSRGAPRDAGDRRDRKGNEVWSNSGGGHGAGPSAKRRAPKRRPQRV